LYDSVEIDDHGKPAAALITEPFVPTAQAIAKIRALPDYPFVILKHPIGSLTDEDLNERADDALAQIAAILCV